MPVSVDQATVCKKLLAYLQLRRASKAIQAMFGGKGLCFGFSIGYSAMHLTGKLAWWQAALIRIAEWDGDPASLAGEILLPAADEGKKISLESLFERIISYLAFNFADARLLPSEEDLCVKKKDQRDNFSTLPLAQQEFLEVNGLFEVVDGDEVKRVKTSVKVAGHFSTSNLANLLQAAFISDAMLLVENFSHACSIRYEADYWYFYNPNNVDGEQVFSSVEELAAELIRQLGPDLNMTLASFKSEDPALEAFLTCYNSIPLSELLKGYGLQILYRFGFDLSIMVRAAQASYLSKGVFIDALLKGNGDYFGLTVLANSNFRLVGVALEMILATKEDKERLAEIIATTKEGAMVLYLVRKFNPVAFQELLSLVIGMEGGQENLMRLLKLSRDGSRKNLLSLLVDVDETLFLNILEIVKKQQSYQRAFLRALFISDDKGNLLVYQLAKHSSQIIESLIHPDDTVDNILIKMAYIQKQGAKWLVDNNMSIIHEAIQDRIEGFSIIELAELRERIHSLPNSDALYRRERGTGRVLQTVILKATLGIIEARRMHLVLIQQRARQCRLRVSVPPVGASRASFFSSPPAGSAPSVRDDAKAPEPTGEGSPKVITVARYDTASRDVQKIRFERCH